MRIIRDLVFWPACVRLRPFEDHLAAAVAGGFTSLAIAAETVREARARGLSATAIGRMAEDAGVPIRHFDTLTAWASIRIPDWAGPEMRARFDVTMEESLDICSALGITNILAVAGYPPDTLPHEVLVEGFCELCDRVAPARIWVDLEFMPFLGLPNLAAAWAIVGAADRANSGLMIDTWHFAKSDSDIEFLETIPPRHLRSMQMSDGYRHLRSGSLLVDTVRWREFPGEGELPVLELLEAVAAGGYLTHLGPEVFAERADAMDPIEAGRHSGETARAIMALGGIVLTP